MCSIIYFPDIIVTVYAVVAASTRPHAMEMPMPMASSRLAQQILSAGDFALT